MAKVMVYVSDELKQQMDAVPEVSVNWSLIAQNAFAKRCRGENQSPVSYDDLFRSLEALVHDFAAVNDAAKRASTTKPAKAKGTRK